MNTVAIYPGHAGKDPGAVDSIGPSGDGLYTVESVIAYAVAGHCEDYLNSVGIDTALSVGPFERRIDQTRGCVCGISIHVDVSQKPSSHGHHCIYYPRSKQGKRLAYCIDGKLSLTYDRSRQPHSSNELYILRKTAFPCVIVEVGFLSNPTEESWLWNREHQKTIGFDISQGLRDWLYTL